MTYKPPSKLITDSVSLAKFCEHAAQSDALAVDTEFIMERTYWPDLCLIQLATRDAAVAVDYKCDDIDFEPLWDIMVDPKIEKIFHSSFEDVMILKRIIGEVPAPVFDTQFAYTFIYAEDNPSYATMVRQLFNVKLDKSQQRTDWAARPLDKRQVDYALKDVTYLIQAYDKVKHRLKKFNRLSWYSLEQRMLLARQHSENNNIVDKLRRFNLRSPDGLTLSILQELYSWRERAAQSINKPARWVMADNILGDIAATKPRRQSDLDKVRTLPKRFEGSGRNRTELWNAIQRGLDTPEDQRPVPKQEERLMGDPRLNELLRYIQLMTCSEHSIAPSIVASAADLRKIASKNNKDSALLKGWRYEVFGKLAMKFINGEVAISYSGRRVSLVEKESKLSKWLVKRPDSTG